MQVELAQPPMRTGLGNTRDVGRERSVHRRAEDPRARRGDELGSQRRSVGLRPVRDRGTGRGERSE